MHGRELGRPQARFRHGRQITESQAQRPGLAVEVVLCGKPERLGAEPLREHVRSVKVKHVSAAGIGVEQAGEPGLDARGLIQEGQGPDRSRQRGWQALAVLGRLDLDGAQRGPGLLGFHGANGLAIDVQQIVGLAVAGDQREFPNGDAPSRMEIDRVRILHDPARRYQLAVDVFSGAVFRLHAPNLG